jgi:acetate kinase
VRVLVVNAGSSSLKVDLVDDGQAVGTYDGLPVVPPRVDAVGHRIVHGGPDLVQPVVIDGDVERRLRDLVALAPLHQPKSLAGLDAARRLLPDVPHVACFDTAFHATLPTAARTYALPSAWRQRWGVRRYGFHGLSHAWAARRAAELAPGSRRVVTCHLGAGASLAAVLDGRSVDTTMGFTPLDGLVMATRSGSVDPGLLLWLEEHEGLRPHEVADALEHASGLLALAGTADMREIVGRADEDARLALGVYLHRLASGILAMTAALGGLDTLVFTGGVGERSPVVRAGAATRLPHLGVSVDGSRNDAAVLTDGGDRDAEITAAGARVRTLVVRSREDLQIAADVRRALAAGGTVVRTSAGGAAARPA